jgi:hypothetical protein
LLLLICGFVNFVFMLVLHAAAEHIPEMRRSGV